MVTLFFMVLASTVAMVREARKRRVLFGLLVAFPYVLWSYVGAAITVSYRLSSYPVWVVFLHHLAFVWLAYHATFLAARDLPRWRVARRAKVSESFPEDSRG